MFFIVFILFFSKYFQTNSLKCMTNQVGKTCEFIHDINKSIPTDNELTSAISSCTIGEAETDFSLFKVTGSCYGEVEIDYNKKTMKIYLTHVSSAQTFSSPYDDMLGFLKGIKSVVQYKINGNLETDKIQMTTRIQCVTNDNCALDKLRALISNLTISDTRKNIFKELKNFLNPSESNPSSQLTCMDNDDDQVDCQDDQNRCKFDLKKTGMEKSCTTADSDGEFDLEYRFNLIQEISDIGIDNSAKSFKCTYLCKTDLCNSEDNFMKIDGILNALAMGSESKAKSHTTNDKNSATSKRKSDSVSLYVLFYFRLMIIFFLCIQFLLH